jgi:protein-S-isoprenylcysteine O-methyltransferase Ste14
MFAAIGLSATLASQGWHQYGRWDLFALSLLLHGAVLGLFIVSTVLPRRRVANLPNGALLAFLVALFAEMYGLPLTVYLLQPLLPFNELFYPVPLAVRLSGSALMLAGFLLVFAGWRLIFRGDEAVVEHGIYSWIRHPQYLGLMVLTLGQLVEWPTLTGLILWPLVVILYARLARKEDAEVVARYGEPALTYQQRVPAFFPHLGVRVRDGASAAVRRASRGGRMSRRAPAAPAHGSAQKTGGDRRRATPAPAGRQSEQACLPRELKVVGALVLFVVSFFASTLVVLLLFEALGATASPGNRALGIALIGGLGVLFFLAGLCLLLRRGDQLMDLLAGHVGGVVARAMPAARKAGSVRTNGAQRPARLAAKEACGAPRSLATQERRERDAV